MADMPRVILLLYPYAGYDRGILKGILRYARVHGPWVFYLAGQEPGLPMPDVEAVSGMLVKTFRVGARRQMHLPDLRQWGVTGIIGRLQNDEITREALGSRAPLIAMDLSDEQFRGKESPATLSEIRPDSHRAGRMAAEHLLERGLKNFGFCGYEGRGWSKRRQQGFRERIEEAGHRCCMYEPPRRRTPLTWQQERPRLTAWLRALPKPVGLMACNDLRGRQVIEASLLGGVSVPDEVAVVGVDDDPVLCELSHPPLSSVAFNTEESGYRAAELLDELMSRKVRKPRQILVEPLWVVSRQSTDVVAVDDPEVAAALRFIHEKARQPIGVMDVVDQRALSRRMLEIRFNRCLGRSIRDEIQRVRLTWTKQLLLETDFSMTKIADATGFNSLSYLSKVFHRETGETLAQYRRRRRSS